MHYCMVCNGIESIWIINSLCYTFFLSITGYAFSVIYYFSQKRDGVQIIFSTIPYIFIRPYWIIWTVFFYHILFINESLIIMIIIIITSRIDPNLIVCSFLFYIQAFITNCEFNVKSLSFVSINCAKPNNACFILSLYILSIAVNNELQWRRHSYIYYWFSIVAWFRWWQHIR